MCRPGWRLALRPLGTRPLPLESRIGGLPALPRSFAWPEHKGRSLSFVCQVNLREVADDAASELPREGLLSFFAPTDEGCWGGDPEDVGAFHVSYFEDAASCLPSTSWPKDIPPERRYKTCPVVFRQVLTIPPDESVLAESAGFSPEERERFAEIGPEITARLDPKGTWSERTLLLGHPDQIQGDLSLEFAECFSRAESGSRGGGPRSGRAAVKALALGSRMLLQLHSCRRAGMMWGDLGCLYYWIRESDIKSRSFTRALGILQCG
jgi:uncharacterized protein YwqG